MKNKIIYDRRYGFLTDTLYNVSLNIFSSGTNVYTENWSWGPEIRDYYIFHYVIEGEALYYINNKTYNVKPGQLLVVYPNTLSELETITHPYKYYWVNFSGAVVKNIIKNIAVSPSSPVVSLNFSLEEDFFSLFSVTGDQLYHQANMIAYLYFIFSKLIKASESLNEPDTQKNLYLKASLEYISSNYFNKISISDIANYVNISKSYLYRIFKDEFGITPQKYINDLRIEKSMKLLKDTNLQIKQIAQQVGFDDPLYFSKVFQKVVKMSPSEFKKD